MLLAFKFVRSQGHQFLETLCQILPSAHIPPRVSPTAFIIFPYYCMRIRLERTDLSYKCFDAVTIDAPVKGLAVVA